MSLLLRALACTAAPAPPRSTQAGTYTFRIGFSSRDIKATLPLALKEYTDKTSNALAPQQPLNLLKQ